MEHLTLQLDTVILISMFEATKLKDAHRQGEEGYLFENYVPHDLHRWIYVHVKKNYPGKKGGKTQEKFFKACLRFTGFLIYRYHVARKSGKLEFSDTVMFARTEEPLAAKQGIQNPRKVRRFLMEQGILVPRKDEQGRDYSHRSADPYARRYRVKIGEKSVLPLTQLQ